MRMQRDDVARVIRIDATDTDGVSLGILEKTCLLRDQRLPPVLLVHGATFGAALFDLPVPGYSLMSALSDPGRPIYALDIRGYGNSLNGPVMDAPPETHPPFARLKDAVNDVGAAVTLICAREQVSAIDIVGFSWGTVTAARYASQFPRHVSRLALYAPLYAELNEAWLTRIGDPNDRTRIDPKIGAYRMITQDDVLQRWNADIGPVEPGTFRDPGIPEVIFESLSVLDPKSGSYTPRAFRSPTGALADLVSIFNGRPLYDPAKITMPTLLIRGANDTTSTHTDSERLLSALASPGKEYRVITPGSHFLCVEKNRTELYDGLNRFLETDRR
jgi:pimeloyl-ACP methyl ester carboxylesterase